VSAAFYLIHSCARGSGFNDVSLHGSKQIPTPHIDALAASGVTLMNYHANPSCSPTRASILTGRHMIHHGIFAPFRIGFSGALDSAFTLLPQYLQRLGMRTHMIGKV
jgi:arylsulfatase B